MFVLFLFCLSMIRFFIGFCVIFFGHWSQYLSFKFAPRFTPRQRGHLLRILVSENFLIEQVSIIFEKKIWKKKLKKIIKRWNKQKQLNLSLNPFHHLIAPRILYSWIKMAENAGPSTEEVAEDEEENFNYYECKYLFFLFWFTSICQSH